MEIRSLVLSAVCMLFSAALSGTAVEEHRQLNQSLPAAQAVGGSRRALIVFGDSIVDPGNNNNIPTVAKANLRPYGRDFLGRRPTGRFSNGKIPPDLMASAIGIKEYLPAYLDPELKEEDILTGVSFASGAAGFDNLTSHFPKVFSLWDQLEMYKEYQGKLAEIAGEEKAAEIISRSPHVIFAGSNDILVSYFITRIRALTFDLPSYINYLVDAACSFILELYALGARKIVVAGLPPLGCLPSSRTLAGGIHRECVGAYNDAAAAFNAELTAAIEQLNQQLSQKPVTPVTTTTVYAEIYDQLMEIIHHPADYGFEITTKGCCGTGLVEASILCNELSPCTCPESETHKYLFWDGFHPTEKAFKIVISSLVPQFMKYL